MSEMVSLGSIDFINSLPVDYALRSGVIHASCRIVRGTPSRLNAMISKQILDISPVSSLHYAEHSKDLLLLPDFSISSHSGVKSVLLFSRIPLEDLGGQTITIPAKGKATPALLQILLRKRYGMDVRMVRSVAGWERITAEDSGPALLIGDDALIAASQADAGLHVYDLAEEWYRWKRLPFVFAVWVVRKKFLQSNPEGVAETLSALHASRRWAQRHRDVIVRVAQERTGLSSQIVEPYFRDLRYDFDADLRKGMTCYVGLAAEMGLAPEGVSFLNREEEFLPIHVPC